MISPWVRLACLSLVLAVSPGLYGQNETSPTALRSVDMTLFGGITGVYTGLSHGENRAATAGMDLNLPSIARFRPSLEIRAIVPIDRGTVDNQKSLLAGPRVELYLGRIHPYVDLLVGRGQLTFSKPYTDYNGRFVPAQPRSTVVSPGAGVRVDLIGNLSALGDVQFQRWDTTASLSGHLFAKPFTAGLVYRFTAFGRYPKR